MKHFMTNTARLKLVHSVWSIRTTHPASAELLVEAPNAGHLSPPSAHRRLAGRYGTSALSAARRCNSSLEGWGVSAVCKKFKGNTQHAKWLSKLVAPFLGIPFLTAASAPVSPRSPIWTTPATWDRALPGSQRQQSSDAPPEREFWVAFKEKPKGSW